MGMNRTFKASVATLVLAVGFAGSAAAGPFEDTVAALKKGDYANVLTLAEQGNAIAQGALGFIYYEGRVVPQDYAAAAGWMRKAAEQGDAEAQYNLGLMYAKGRGVPQDYVTAHMWLNLAAAKGVKEKGVKEAVKYRNTVAALMTPAQIAEAQKLAREWKPK
jgi:uncharacterized protein